MKNYEKPIMKEEEVKLVDIIAISSQESTADGDTFALDDLFPDL